MLAGRRLTFPFLLTVLTGVLPNGYDPPTTLCWDQICSDNPIVDDDSDENNVQSVVTYFLGIAADQVRERELGLETRVLGICPQ